MRSILLVDDDPAVLGFLESALRRSGYSVITAYTAEQGLVSYTRDSTDVVILDLNLPDISGQDVLTRIRSTNPDASVIVLTGQADLQTAVDAMRAGAENFLAKPIDLHLLRVAIEHAFQTVDLRRRARYLEQRVQPEQSPEPVVLSGALQEVERRIALVAPTDTTVLMQGETGTGKSWVARRIHELSTRSRGPFVEINCAGLSATFLDSELFGHEKGAFTDAKTAKRGLIEVAERGTLFLDEIGDLAFELQPKLLHVLETRRFRRLGGTREMDSNVRLIAATNRDLKRAVAAGTFREDLYYRLAVMPIFLPPLRERDPADLNHLTDDLLSRLQSATSGAPKKLRADACRLITQYAWPGNIRELRNVLERALILAGNTREITPAHLPAELVDRAPAGELPRNEIELTLAELEQHHIQRVLEYCAGNRSRAARILGLSRVGLYKKLRRLSPAAPKDLHAT